MQKEKAEIQQQYAVAEAVDCHCYCHLIVKFSQDGVGKENSGKSPAG
ncbi:hypothetical protein IIA15_04520 [candidate division TA06 bacterium]|nr:hypothetical protein [candidate division TA06 bacterium]